MNFENKFGSRPSPSLAEAMGQTPQLGQQWICTPPNSTPNCFSQSSISTVMRVSSQQANNNVVIYSPHEITAYNHSQPMQPIDRFDANLDEVEQRLCYQLDLTLKRHCKTMKSKLKNLRTKVIQSDASMKKLHELVDGVSIRINEISCEPINMQPIILTRSPVTNRIESQEEKSSKKITWRRMNTEIK